MKITHLIVVIALGLPGTVAAQQAELPLVQLSVKHVRARAGEDVVIPILVTSEMTLSETLYISATFSPEQLRLVEVTPGVLVEKAGWRLVSSVRDSRDSTDEQDETKVLELALSPIQPVFFPSGAIGYARFALAQDLEPGEIDLPTTMRAETTRRLELRAENLKIIVQIQPIYGCFFYMH